MSEEKKPEIKIKDWRFEGNRLIGKIEDHPRLGSCKDGEVVTSRIEKVETRNTVYVLEEQ